MSVRSLIAPWGRFVEPIVEVLSTGQLPERSVTIYEGRNRVVKVTCPEYSREVNIKAFRIPNIINRIAYTTLRHSKARRSYDHSLLLRNLGFNTPEPLAYVERRKGLLLEKSYFLSQQLSGFHELRSFLPDENIDRLADQLGALIARLHDVGVWVKDFSQGNVLRRLGERNRYEFFLVDLNRIEFDGTDRHKLMRNFLHVTEDGAFWYKLVKAYARHARIPYAQALAEAHKAARYRFLK